MDDSGNGAVTMREDLGKGQTVAFQPYPHVQLSITAPLEEPFAPAPSKKILEVLLCQESSRYLS